ncbi:MAG: CopG family transcriptional regulator [Thermoprotei archaeon]|nr:MAG: CopG family transcriptional regulator [Thermoprotei archaeon]
MGEGKKRFGISISTKIADELSELAKRLGVNRSSLIEEALKEFLHDHIHYLTPHMCKGIMVLTGKYEKEALMPIIEDFKDIIHSYMHMHVDEVCIEIILVSGHSSKIATLHSTLERSLKGCKVRYLPIKYEIIK